MEAPKGFDLTVTVCFTPEHLRLAPHHTRPPQHVEEYADFCVAMMRRYAPGGQSHSVPDGKNTNVTVERQTANTPE
jgi:beta-xylosidase